MSSEDFEFNLPVDLSLPTVHELRDPETQAAIREAMAPLYETVGVRHPIIRGESETIDDSGGPWMTVCLVGIMVSIGIIWVSFFLYMLKTA